MPAHQRRLRAAPADIGAHLCAYLADQWDVYGSDVNLTARIATLPGQAK